MSYELVFHPAAEKEYQEAYVYYERQKKGLGTRFERTVEDRVNKILDNPEFYHYVKPPYREVSIDVFPFVIVYKLLKRKKLIIITAIYHTKRDPKHKLRK